jgi:DNA-binding NarL/FixJ family response regulator
MNETQTKMDTGIVDKIPTNWKIPLPSPQELTDAQKLVLTLFAQGWGTKEIGDMLKVSPKTIEYHRSKLFSVFKTNSIAVLTRVAIYMGLVQD